MTLAHAPDAAPVLVARGLTRRFGARVAVDHVTLSVPRGAVSSIRTRTLDRRKSWIMAGLGVIGAIALGDAFGLGSGFGGFLGTGDGGGKK